MGWLFTGFSVGKGDLDVFLLVLFGESLCGCMWGSLKDFVVKLLVMWCLVIGSVRCRKLCLFLC